MPGKSAKALFLVIAAGIQIGCASHQTIPMKVQSDPLGAYVLMKVRAQKSAEADWIYLGSTPLTTQRRFDKNKLQGDRIVILRLIKEGYIDQIKEWRAGEIRSIGKTDGHLFWNPKLVRAQ